MSEVFIVMEENEGEATVDSVWATPEKAEDKKRRLVLEADEYEGSLEYSVVTKKVLH